MLRELRIRNFALVDRLQVEFGPGLNVVTGETGAGKTVIFEALALLLGRKSRRPPVREGAKEALLQGLFDLKDYPAFPEPDLLDEDGSLLLERKIPLSGRGRVEANGRLIPMEKLRLIGRSLVDFHGQQERENLLDRSLQMAYLDAYAGAGDRVRRYTEAVHAMEEAHALRRKEEERVEAVREREDFLRWQAREIDEASIRPGEEEEIEEDVSVLRESEKIRELVFHTHNLLRESDASATDLVGEAADRLERTAAGDAGAAAQACRRALAEIEDALSIVDGLAERIDAPAGALDRAVERLEVIASLKRKHKRSVEEILTYREEIAADLALVDESGETVERMREEEARLAKKAAAEAVALSGKRRATAAKIGKKITASLKPLALKGARFEVRVEPVADLEGRIETESGRYRAGRDGIDRVDFLFAANRGEPLLPLRQVASGGETSRIMLAVKRVLSEAASVPTAHFDEIDAGVGGDVGEKVGEALLEVSALRQVFCITHLPSIAGQGDHHLLVKKKVEGERTVIRVAPLEAEERVEELVRMLGGASRSVTVPHAEEILRGARRKGS